MVGFIAEKIDPLWSFVFDFFQSGLPRMKVSASLSGIKTRWRGKSNTTNLDWTNRKTEIGYWLGESFQGRGLVTKSCRVLIDYAFNELKLNRVEMRCGVENKKSRNIPEKLGFREEGVVRQAGWLHDHFVDYVIYGMLASEWRDEGKL